MRKDCKAITEGEMVHFVPLDGKIYVYFRYLRDNNENVDDSNVVMVVVNFSEENKEVDLCRFKEMLPISICDLWHDVICDKEVSLNSMTSIMIKSNGIIILERNKND